MTALPRATRAPWPWLLLVLLATASGWYAWRAFPAAFPLLELDVRMDRGAALTASDSIAHALEIGPATDRRVAVFHGDAEAQTFVELEGGGAEAFRTLVHTGEHLAWKWEVRRFRPGTPHELRIFFGPGGIPAGFRELLPEDSPGPGLETDAARAIALQVAARDWGLTLGADWVELPAAAEARPNGRRDHTFTWERAHPSLGEGRFRLELVVSGDRLTTFRQFIRVPEAFTRRYQEIRSANEGLAAGATFGMFLLYGLGGVVIGLVILARRQRLYLRAAVWWSVGLATVVALSVVNFVPLAWLEYDTALPLPTFWLQQVGLVVAALVGLSLMFVASFLGGENLSRAGFTSHPFLWGSFGGEAGASGAMLRRVLIGMLLTPVFLGYAVGFSALSGEWSGWWSPLTPLIEPNLIATPLPWLPVIAGPLQAAVWEELLFRAVPFGAALLLARRFGGRNAWLAGAFVIQAVIFAAAHANYPAQPAHARLVELLLPSFLFGALFLRWGLIPVIVLHFEYDLALFALPLFATPTTALLGSKLIVIAAGLAPLAFVLLRRAQAGAWVPLTDAHRNAGHLAAPTDTKSPGAVDSQEPGPASPPSATVSPSLVSDSRWVVLAAIGTTVWLAGVATAPSPATSFSVPRQVAITAALDTLVRHGVDTTGWAVVARISGGVTDAHHFVWQTAGRAVHDDLLGRYLPLPRWEVALRRHEGDVVDRAEEWTAWIDGGGRPWRVIHRRPQHAPDTSLTESEARARAEAALVHLPGLDPGALEAIAAVPTEQPARRDWLLTWVDTTGPPIGEGQLRVEVEVSGGEVVRVGRRVHIPEEWARQRRATTIQRMFPAFLTGAILVGLLVAGGVAALVRLSRRTLARGRALRVAALVALLGIIAAWNGWPVSLFGMTTTEPLALQLWLLVAALAIGLLVVAIGSGLLAGLPVQGRQVPFRCQLLPGFAIGALVVGLRAALGMVARGSSPRLGGTPPLDQQHPVLAAALGPTSEMLSMLVLIIAVQWAIRATARSGVMRQGLGWLVLLAVALAVSGAAGSERPALLVVGLVSGGALVWWGVRGVLGHYPAAIAVAAGTVAAFDLLRTLAEATWPGAWVGGVAGLVILVWSTRWLAGVFAREAAPADAT
ncbi:MAG: hypothetical protein ABR551_07200 [Gemmatimonadales bacterium]